MIELTIVTPDDIPFFYDIKCDQDNMYWCDGDKPQYENIERYLTEVIEKKEKYANRTIFIISEEKVKKGYVYVDNVGQTAEISIAVMLRYAGRGVALQALNILEKKYIDSRTYIKLASWVREDNLRSQHLFTKAGYTASGLKKELNIINIGRTVTMLQFTKTCIAQHKEGI